MNVWITTRAPKGIRKLKQHKTIRYVCHFVKDNRLIELLYGYDISFSFNRYSRHKYSLGFSFCLSPTPRGYFHRLARTLPLSLFLLFLCSLLPLSAVLASSLETTPATVAAELWCGGQRVHSKNFVKLSECCKSKGVLFKEKIGNTINHYREGIGWYLKEYARKQGHQNH